jgi:hypothetical protein
MHLRSYYHISSRDWKAGTSSQHIPDGIIADSLDESIEQNLANLSCNNFVEGNFHFTSSCGKAYHLKALYSEIFWQQHDLDATLAEIQRRVFTWQLPSGRKQSTELTEQHWPQ